MSTPEERQLVYDRARAEFETYAASLTDERIQARAHRWRARTGNLADPDTLIRKLVEELGELAVCLSKSKGDPTGVAEECADVTAILRAICNHYRVDLDAAELAKLEVVEAREKAAEVRRREAAHKRWLETPRLCNRHADCHAAEAAEVAAGRTVGANFHCNDDCCEDCFGT